MSFTLGLNSFWNESHYGIMQKAPNIIISINPSDHCLEWNIFSKRYIIKKIVETTDSLMTLTKWPSLSQRIVPISQYVY